MKALNFTPGDLDTLKRGRRYIAELKDFEDDAARYGVDPSSVEKTLEYLADAERYLKTIEQDSTLISIYVGLSPLVRDIRAHLIQ